MMFYFAVIAVFASTCANAVVFPDWCVIPGTVHILQNETCNTYSSLADNSIEWYAMKGEQEAKQILIDTRTWSVDFNMSGNISIEFGDLYGTNGVVESTHLQWLQVGYVYCQHTVRYADSGGGWRPDPLLYPSSPGNTVTLEVPLTSPLWISIHVPYMVENGVYKGEMIMSVSLPDVTPMSTKIPVTLTVWNISLPDLKDSKFPAVFSFSPGEITEVYGKETNLVSPLFYDMLTDQRVGGDDLYTEQPTNLTLAEQLSARGIPWLSLYDVYGAAGIDENIRLSGVCVNFTSDLVQKVMAILTPVVEKYITAGILDNMFVYGFDEVGPDCEESIGKLYGAIKTKWPMLRTMATLNWPPPTNLPLDVWVLQYEHYNSADAAKWITAGKQQWWYHCIEPSGTEYLNTFIERPLIMARLLFWLAGAHEVGGWLYYSSVMWKHYPPSSAVMKRLNGTARTDFDPANYIWLPRTDIFANGDGNFLYPGLSGPIGSARLRNIRDGFEDVELFRMISLDKVNEVVTPLVRSATNYTLDPALLEKQRIFAASLIH